MRIGVDDDDGGEVCEEEAFVEGGLDEPLGMLPTLVLLKLLLLLLLLLPGWKTRCNGRLAASTSKSPRTMWSSGAMLRRNSYVSLSVRLPRHSTVPILPGVRSFLNCSIRRGKIKVSEVQCNRRSTIICEWAGREWVLFFFSTALKSLNISSSSS